MKISVKVIPNAKVEKVEILGNDSLKLWVKGKAVEGEANKSVIELLSKHYNTPKSMIYIVSGRTSKNKIVDLTLRK